MNMQAILKQAKQMQQQMLKEKEAIDNTIFSGKSSLVEVEVNGKKEVKSVKISSDSSLEKDDLEILEDMIVVALNDAFSKVDKVTEEKMSKFGPGVSGLM